MDERIGENKLSLRMFLNTAYLQRSQTMTTSYTVHLTWQYVHSDSAPESGFKVFRRLASTSVELDVEIGESPPTVLFFDDDTVVFGETYMYTVKAFNDAGFSSGVSFTLTVTIPVPPPPSNLAATVIAVVTP